MREVCRLEIGGRPISKGSWRAMCGNEWKHKKRPKTWLIPSDPKGAKAWAENIKIRARLAMDHHKPLQKALYLRLTFFCMRPDYHYGTRAKKPVRRKEMIKERFLDADPTSKAVGDIDKLLRALMDGLYRS